MNNIRTIIAVILLFFSNYCFGQQISIKTNNPEASIFLNDSLVAVGNYSGNVNQQTLYIKVVADLKIWNGETFTDTIKLTPEEDYFFDYAFGVDGTNNQLIQTIPGDAEVIANDSLIGRTPLYIGGISANTSITLQKYGYNSLTYHGVSKLDIPVELTKAIPLQHQKKFTDSNWFYVLLGSAAVLGATAAYFKAEADSNFDEYEKTDDRSFLDKTDRYDTYSGIALGALQINFGILIYEFLTD